MYLRFNFQVNFKSSFQNMDMGEHHKTLTRLNNNHNNTHKIMHLFLSFCLEWLKLFS